MGLIASSGRAPPARLKRFDVEASGRDVVIRVEDDKGTVMTLVATREQLDLMADLIDDALLSDETGDEGD